MHSGDPLPSPTPRRSGRRHLGFALLATGAALLLLPVLGWQWMELNPRLIAPTRTLPAHNAFDDFKAAAALFGESESNRLTALAASHPRPGPHGTSVPRHSPAEQAAFVRRQAHVLARFRKGLAHPYEEPLRPSATQVFDHYAAFRNLARLLRLEGQVRIRQGDWVGGLESNLDALQLGVEVPRGSAIIGLLVGSAIQAIGRRDAWDSVARLPPGAARTAARRLERICARQAPFWKTLETDRWYSQVSLSEFMRKPGWRRRLLSDLSNFGGPAQPWPRSGDEWMLFAELHATSKTAAFNNLTHYFDAAIAVARQPHGLTAPLPPTPTDPVNQLSSAPLENARFFHARDRALNELLLLSLALRAYHDAYGRYPAALAELAPPYLSALPLDPFAGTAPYRYRRTPTGYVLYSLGPDRKDDGGRALLSPTFAASGSPDRQYRIEAGAVGDIVAGTNIQ